jgi:hypothetical protein
MKQLVARALVAVIALAGTLVVAGPAPAAHAASAQKCSGTGCTLVVLLSSGDDLVGRVEAYGYPARKTLCADGIIYNGRMQPIWNLPAKCEYRASSGTLTNGFRIPDCAPDFYTLVGWTWVSRSNTQPSATTHLAT